MRRSALVAVAAVMAIAVPYPLLWPEPQAPAPTPIEEFTAAEQPANNPAADEAAIAPDKDQSRVEATTAKASTAAATRPEANCLPLEDCALDPMPPKRDLTYLADYAYSEVPPDEKPADTVLNYLISLPIGTPLDEIRRAAEAFGLDFGFMKTVAKIESDFGPTQRTGSYIGLFQLSHYEFNKYGSGYITNPRDNAIAAAYKFATAAALFELATHRKPSIYDLYLIHQQGTQGAEEHVGHPERTAWKSMCATDEGREKGEKWCKRAIWANTLPAVKHIWKSVENLTSGEFVKMWQARIDLFNSRYTEANAAK
ncbi:MAG: transglycosylase [Xanthobacteraceae bacterium]|jgi:hypothetical protein